MPFRLLEFDPYEVWLGIKIPQRPLNPYQLLNLMPLDADRSRVRAALDRQQTILEGRRATADPEAWQKLHDELESAAATLLDSERRAVIDAAIKRKLALAKGSRPGENGKARAAANGAGALVCPGCHHENPSSARFCGGCGQGLWETCPQCGAELSVEQRFCGNCGTNVRGILQEQTQQIEERLAAAGRLAEEFRFDAALSALRGVAALDNPKLEPFAARALREIEQVESLKRQHLAEAQSAKEQAAKLFESHAFDWAIKVLESIPPPLRDEEAGALLARAQFARQELESLLVEIKEDVQQKRTWDLFRKIDRVLALKPDHEQVLELAEKLRQRYAEGANTRLEENRYEDAAQMLLQIPVGIRNDLILALLDKSRELTALWADLKQSPYATEQTLALAERLAKFAPSNAAVAEDIQRLKKRCATRPTDPRFAVSAWAIARERRSGPAVDWLGNFLRPHPASDQIAQTLREHPGEFFAALGLGLAGLDLAPLDISLMPPEKGSVLARLASMPLLSRGATSAWGIDLGGYAVKALKLVKESSRKVRIEQCEYIPYKKPLAHPDAEGERLGILTEALADLAGRASFKGSRVVAAIPGQRVLGRFFELPPLPAKKMAGAVEYEARHQIPIDLDELCWGWARLDGDDKQTDQQPTRVMVVAARQAHVEERLGVFKSAGITVDKLLSDCLALHNALRFELQGESATPQSIGLLDVGADESNFVVSMPHAVWFRSFPQGGDAFTSALLKQFQLTYDQAELLKRQPAKARRYYQFREAIEPLLVQLASEIDRSLASFQKQQGEVPVMHLHVLGGGSQLHGLVRHLRQK